MYSADHIGSRGICTDSSGCKSKMEWTLTRMEGLKIGELGR